MSILTDLIEQKITFSQAASEAEACAAKLIGNDATLTAATGSILSDVKQAASNAVDMADSALASYILPASKAVETALETALAGATKGLTIPFNPLISDGIDTIANAIKAEADAWALKTKAALSTTPPVTSNSTIAPVVASPPQQ